MSVVFALEEKRSSLALSCTGKGGWSLARAFGVSPAAPIKKTLCLRARIFGCSNAHVFDARLVPFFFAVALNCAVGNHIGCFSRGKGR